MGSVFARLCNKWRLTRDPIGYARSVGAKIGENCRLIALKPSTLGGEPYLVKIGDHVTVSSDVRFITHDGGVWVFREEHPDIDLVAPIIVGSNVFIGACSIIMPGVRIGDDCVIGAGAVVTKDIPSGSVAVGVPARVIGSIDDYWEKVKHRTASTCGMTREQKREFYERRFGPELAE